MTNEEYFSASSSEDLEKARKQGASHYRNGLSLHYDVDQSGLRSDEREAMARGWLEEWIVRLRHRRSHLRP